MVRRTLLLKTVACSSRPKMIHQPIESVADSRAPGPIFPIVRQADRGCAQGDACDQTQLLHSRNEGEFLLSYQTSGGWVAITKDVLTEVLGAGRDAKIVGLPRVAAGVLKLMCPSLVMLPENVPPCSPRGDS